MTETRMQPNGNPFAGLGLSDPLLRAIREVGFEEPMPVQAEAIPIMLAGRDLIAQAHTGTGKTAAFALPILQRLEPDGTAPQALVLTPTRELAVQVAQTFHRLGKYLDTRVLAVYGGQPIERQLRALRHPVDVVVGTPGRVMDHLRRETLRLDQVRVVILDEADEMLNMGFIEDVEWILERTPRERQTGLFSATIPDRVAELARRYLRDPVRIAIEPERVTAPRTTQVFYEVAPRAKVEALARILDLETPASAIVFCRTKSGVDELAHALQALGYAAEAIHGDMSQVQRDRVMARFRSGQAELLIATDLAARGLDIPIVSHVINYDIPSDPESYVHRIGRTGRAGAPGVAITLVTPRERWMLRTIERAIGQRLQQRTTPTRQQIVQRQRELLGASLIEMIERNDLDWAMRLVDELAAYHDPAVIAAAAVKLLAQQRNLDPERAESLFEEETDQPEPGMTRLILNLGRRDGIRPMDVVGAIANEARIPGKRIGQIEIGERQTTVEIPEELTERVARALSRTRLRGKPVRVETTRTRPAVR
ncbi:DEAD/DEAH box helicase [Thermomicrobiaceae bacterium CFH 74404]|uniref:DEAD-box ATP-dependent RNA helicase RhpA n=1 Tax=Thermalbibacter longus TaxID=2951981 RepID=A0AA41W9M4_9BACT|nr:DEAD/DEAH box helicase [Thermalbibacter longus]MCM8747686.1 DEAD/DEAH box helicase [Thermalbibacter longus]